MSKQDQQAREILRITTVEYDAGMEMRKKTGWAARLDRGGVMRSPGTLGSPSQAMAYLFVEDRDRPVSEQEMVQIPWHRIVTVVVQPDL